METSPVRVWNRGKKQFQKDLIVWKHTDKIEKGGRRCSVSEGLNSVETYRNRSRAVLFVPFQKDLIVWKRDSI